MSATLDKYTIKQIPKTAIVHSILNIPSISDHISIHDVRLLKDFKFQTFGGYKLAQACSALDKALIEDKIEPALHWTLQLFLSGIVQPLWNKFISFACKYINIYNVKLPEFIYNKTIQWHQIVDNIKFSKDNILLLRNHPTIRLLLTEMVTILCLSKKRKINQLPKINTYEFIIDNFKSKLEAKDNRFVDSICIDGDPYELKIAINELSYHIYNSNLNKSLYWFNWITEWEKINSKKYGKYECGSRIIEGIDGKYYKDVVWFMWAAINNIRKIKYTITGGDIETQILCLYKLYINKFTPATRSKKQLYIIWTILYITETLNYATPLVDKPHILFQSLLGFDKIIAHIKTQEVHNHVNNNLTNVTIENNYMRPAIQTTPEHNKNTHKKEKTQPHNNDNNNNNNNKKQLNNDTMVKLNEIYKLDRMMYA